MDTQAIRRASVVVPDPDVEEGMGGEGSATNKYTKISTNSSSYFFFLGNLWSRFLVRLNVWLEKEPGLKLATDRGIYGDDKAHILTYNPLRIRYFLATIISTDITVCNSLLKWVKHIAYLAYAVGLMFFLAYTSYPDGEMGDGPACKADQPSKNFNMCTLNEVFVSMKAEFRFLVAFILAGFVAFSVNTW